MKTIIITLSIMLISLTAVAGEKKYMPFPSGDVEVETVCVAGYLFVVAKAKNGVSITQVYERWKSTYIPQPKKCKK